MGVPRGVAAVRRWLSRFQALLKSAPARINGSYVETESEYVTTLSSRAKFPPNDALLLRLAAQKDLIGERPIRADRVGQIDYETDPPPV